MTDWCRIHLIGPNGVKLASWAISGADHPDLSVVDSLARLQLAALDNGCHIVLCDVCPDLAGLLELVGLRREVGGQPEHGEQPLGVQEGVEPDDPPP